MHLLPPYAELSLPQANKQALFPLGLACAQRLLCLLIESSRVLCCRGPNQAKAHPHKHPSVHFRRLGHSLPVPLSYRLISDIITSILSIYCNMSCLL